MSHKGTAGGYGPVRILGWFFGRLLVFVSLLAMTIGSGILLTASSTHAQNGTPASQDAAQPASSPAPSPQMRKKVELPEGDGKAIAEKACQACHELTNLTHASKSLDDWRGTVQMMVDNGADVPMDKVDILAKYLAQNFGPKTTSTTPDAPATSGQSSSTDASQSAASHPKQAELPDGDGKEIATNSCQACHKLTNLTNAHKSLDDWRETVQLMMDRGAEVAPDKVDTLVHYLAKNFGPRDAMPAGSTTSMAPARPQ
jgi:cytochrome c5